MLEKFIGLFEKLIHNRMKQPFIISAQFDSLQIFDRGVVIGQNQTKWSAKLWIIQRQKQLYILCEKERKDTGFFSRKWNRAVYISWNYSMGSVLIEGLWFIVGSSDGGNAVKALPPLDITRGGVNVPAPYECLLGLCSKLC